jgi:acetyl esterase/lipase
MRLTALGLGALFIIGLASLGVTADAPAPQSPGQTIELWPGKPPGETGTIGEEVAKTKDEGGAKVITSITNVTRPTITVYRPSPGKNTGVAIVVCPGGGYTNLAWDHEGEKVAQWLNSIGVTAAVLKYRVPRREGTPKGQPPVQALMDAQRALSLVRSKADDWGVDSKRVGILGFSAGGHLGAWASTSYDKRSYEPVDAADKVDIRPDFAVLIYPGGAIAKGSEQLNPEIRITSQTPQTFLVHATGDPGSENSVFLYLALKRAGVPVECHLYSKGGHGFGMRPSDMPYAGWIQRCEEWLRGQQILKSDSKN